MFCINIRGYFLHVKNRKSLREEKYSSKLNTIGNRLDNKSSSKRFRWFNKECFSSIYEIHRVENLFATGKFISSFVSQWALRLWTWMRVADRDSRRGKCEENRMRGFLCVDCGGRWLRKLLLMIFRGLLNFYHSENFIYDVNEFCCVNDWIVSRYASSWQRR